MFNNKFSRLLPHPGYNIGGGIGEAALIGAAVGGGTALVTGQDVLTGALLGGATGGLSQGAQGLLGATNTAALTGVDTAVDAGVNITAEAAKDAALNSQIASSQAMLQPTTTAIGGANLTGTGGITAATQNIPTAVSQGAYPNFAANAIPQTAVSDVVLPGAQQGIAKAATQPGLMDQISNAYGNLTPMEKIGVGVGGGALLSAAMAPGVEMPEEDEYKGPLSKFKYNPNTFNASRVVPNVYRPQTFYAAEGGIAALAGGSYPMGRQNNTQFATPTQMPMSAELIRADYEPIEMAVGGMAGTGMGKQDSGYSMADMARAQMLANTPPPKHNPLANFKPTRNINAQRPAARQIYKPRYAEGGIAEYSLGGYAAGGNPRLLKGPGDGMSDDIPATIANKQPARLADGEFVVPADVVSHLGNGSTDAGAKHLYAMMDKVRKARTGSKKQGKQIKPAKFMPA